MTIQEPITTKPGGDTSVSWETDSVIFFVEPTVSTRVMLLRKLSRLLHQYNLSGLKIPITLSLTNQVVTSGGNFILGVYLARMLTLGDFGLYGIGYGICMLYVGIGNAVILTQMAVNMASKEPDQRENYAAKMFNAVCVLGMALLLLTSIVFSISNIIWPNCIRYLNTVCAIAIAATLFLCNEFFISYAYLKRKESHALLVNSITMAVLFLCLALERIADVKPSAENVLFYYSLGAATGATTAYKTSSFRMSQGFRDFMPDMIESWQHGRWALGGVLVTWVQSQTYAYISVIFLGPIGVGQANAAKIFISPFSFLLPAINKIAIPRLVDLRQSNPSRMLHISLLLTLGLSVLTIIYSLLLLSNVAWVSNLVLGRNDSNIEALTWTWCLVLIFQMVRTGGGVLLQVQKKFRILTLLNIPSAIITVVLAFILIRVSGATGAIWSMVAGELTLAFLIWREIAHDQPH